MCIGKCLHVHLWPGVCRGQEGNIRSPAAEVPGVVSRHLLALNLSPHKSSRCCQELCHFSSSRWSTFPSGLSDNTLSSKAYFWHNSIPDLQHLTWFNFSVWFSLEVSTVLNVGIFSMFSTGFSDSIFEVRWEKRVFVTGNPVE